MWLCNILSAYVRLKKHFYWLKFLMRPSESTLSVVGVVGDQKTYNIYFISYRLTQSFNGFYKIIHKNEFMQILRDNFATFLYCFATLKNQSFCTSFLDLSS